MSTSERMLRLLSLLQTHRYWPGPELSERLEVSARTLRRDVDRLRDALDSGQARGAMMRTYLAARDDVQGSPHFFFANGSDVHNPGVRMRQVGSTGAGFLVVDADDPGVYDELVRRAAGVGDEASASSSGS